MSEETLAAKAIAISYIIKPFETSELLARVRLVLAAGRSAPPAGVAA